MNAKAIILVGTQWGDEGKGKATDLLGSRVDVVAKFNGGNNAGHTVVIGNETYTLHLLPSGILTPNVVPVIGSGVVVDIPVLFDELHQLKQRGVDISKLQISTNAHVIMKYHRVLDKAMECDSAKLKIGTTGRGIGPTYADKISRTGIRMSDLFHREILEEKIASVLDSKNQILARYKQPEITVAEVIAEFEPFLEQLKPMVTDTTKYLNQQLDANKTVLFEGGQATMLDVDYGTYPYVTSSSSSAGGAITGTGVGPLRITSVVGVAKAYTTRVGEGPFPTELTLSKDIQLALQQNQEVAQVTHPVSDSDYGQLLLQTGGEFGTTTGRIRRCGWYDSVVVRWASLVNNLSDLVLTKLDVLTGIEQIKICVAYDVDGVQFDAMPSDQYDFERATPIYQIFPGWDENISLARNFTDLPKNARNYVQALEDLSNSRISVVGVGPSRDAIIQLHDIIH